MLANNSSMMTLPHAAQELKMNLGWIPALWASNNDCVLVDDVIFAEKAARRFSKRIANVNFVMRSSALYNLFEEVVPWGWDSETLKDALIYSNYDKVPEWVWNGRIRELSSRENTVRLLPEIRQGIEHLTVGEAYYVQDVALCQQMLNDFSRIVFKSPWSSSGRGVRFANTKLTDSEAGWIKRVIKQQGGVMAEPHYRKVKDFAMEFEALADGRVKYCGLSLFNTSSSAYTGSVLATEEVKRQMLRPYMTDELFDLLVERMEKVLTRFVDQQYEGPLGVDMMIVPRTSAQGFLIHPCVEVNMRRTMGHVALALTPPKGEWPMMMQIVKDVNYRLKVSRYYYDEPLKTE